MDTCQDFPIRFTMFMKESPVFSVSTYKYFFMALHPEQAEDPKYKQDRDQDRGKDPEESQDKEDHQDQDQDHCSDHQPGPCAFRPEDPPAEGIFTAGLHGAFISAGRTPAVVSESGILLGTAKEKPAYAVIESTGPEVKNLKKGDKIIFKEYSTTDVKINGTEYIIVKEEDVLATL